MRERPILFSGPMVRAILAGMKTQTRRIIGGMDSVCYVGPCEGDTGYAHPDRVCSPGPGFHYHDENGFHHGEIDCPYGAPGDRLWVRETWRVSDVAEGEIAYAADGRTIRYVSAGDAAWWKRWGAKCAGGKWAPGIFTKRWASRILLEVTDVHVERLQAISEEDARAEGVSGKACADCTVTRGVYDPACPECLTARDAFRMLWDSINGERAPWASNPWLWAISFRRITP
jgi:hypothetical protein